MWLKLSKLHQIYEQSNVYTRVFVWLKMHHCHIVRVRKSVYDGSRALKSRYIYMNMNICGYDICQWFITTKNFKWQKPISFTDELKFFWLLVFVSLKLFFLLFGTFIHNTRCICIIPQCVPIVCYRPFSIFLTCYCSSQPHVRDSMM